MCVCVCVCEREEKCARVTHEDDVTIAVEGAAVDWGFAVVSLP